MFEKFMQLVNACGVDVELYRYSNGTYDLTIEDFEGFDKNWNEIIRDYDNEEAVDTLLDWLEANCISKTERLYIDYVFSDFQVTLGYASFDI